MSSKRLIIPFLVTAIVLGACSFGFDLNIEQGSGKVITTNRTVSNFDQLHLSGIGDVTLTQGDQETLKIEAEDNVIEHLTTEVKDGVLRIGFDNKTVVPTKPVKFYLSMRDVHKLETSGAANIQSDVLDTDRLEIAVTGTGNVNFKDLTTGQLVVNISGAGNFDALGKADQLKVNLSGAGNFNGEDLQTKSADITITGLGRVVTWATENLSVVISGTGGVDYYGSPQVTQQISGLGKLTHKGEK